MVNKTSSIASVASRRTGQRSRLAWARLWLRIQVHWWRHRGPGLVPATALLLIGLGMLGAARLKAEPPERSVPAAQTVADPTARPGTIEEPLMKQLAQRLPAASIHPGDWPIEQVRQLHEAAARANVAWPQGRYGWPDHPASTPPARSDAAPGLWHIDIEQPLQGGYPDVRRYLDHVQQHWPHLALQRLVLEPAPPGTPGISARLVWRLWWRSTSDPRWPAASPTVTGTTGAWASSHQGTSRRPERQPFEWVQHPPPPTPVAVQAAPPPIPPPLPWIYAGREFSNGQWTIFLIGADGTHGGHPVLARTGETLDGVWRVERIAPPDMTLIYLPLSHTVNLPIGEPL